MTKLFTPAYRLMKGRLAPAAVGAAVAGALAVVFALCFVSLAAYGLSHETYGALSQIGATLLVAFAVEIAGIIKDTRASADQSEIEEFAGGFAALAGFGIAGVLLGLVAAELSRREAAPVLEALVGAVAIGSVVMLGIVVAIAPLAWWWKRQAAIERELTAVED